MSIKDEVDKAEGYLIGLIEHYRDSDVKNISRIKILYDLRRFKSRYFERTEKEGS